MKHLVPIARGLSVALVLSIFSIYSSSAVAQDADADEALEDDELPPNQPVLKSAAIPP